MIKWRLAAEIVLDGATAAGNLIADAKVGKQEERDVRALFPEGTSDSDYHLGRSFLHSTVRFHGKSAVEPVEACQTSTPWVELRLRPIEVRDDLGLGQIMFAVEKGVLGEFAGPGEASAAGKMSARQRSMTLPSVSRNERNCARR